MRIVGGIYKGRTLLEFKGDAIRPTADKVRESLFNILQFNISGKSFLDLFCGTGAMGIEALSRNCSRVVFNDLNRDSIALTKKNLEKIKADGNFLVLNKNAVTLIEEQREKFDIIFIDPPYKSELKKQVLDSVSKILNEDGIVIFEDENSYTEKVENLVKYDERKYGRVYLNFFKGEKQ